MSIALSTLRTELNDLIRTTSTSFITDAMRNRALNEAVTYLYSKFDFDFRNRRYRFDYFDTIHKYSLSTNAPDFEAAVDLRTDDNETRFTKKTPREVDFLIANSKAENAYAIENRAGTNHLFINHTAKYTAVSVHNCDSLTANGTWAVDSDNSDATNLTLDTNEYKEGAGGLNFDADVSQSANNRATITNSTLTALDLSKHENLSSLLFWFWLPESTNFTSVTPYWGSDSSNYYSSALTTDAFGDSFVEGDWNLCRLAWSDATKTGSPAVAAIDYLRFDFNYAAGYADANDFRLDAIKMVRPEKLNFWYQSWYLAKTSAGVYQAELSADADVTLFSGNFDNLKKTIVYFAASSLMFQAGMKEEAIYYKGLADQEMTAMRKLFPSSRAKISRSFEIGGISW